MRSREEVEKELRRIESVRDFTSLSKREREMLPEVLGERERLLYVVEGQFNGGVALAVATDERVFLIDKKFISGVRVEDFTYDRITSIDYETGWLTGSITLHVGSNKVKIERVNKAYISAFVLAVKGRMNRPAGPIPDPVQAPAPELSGTLDVMDRIEKLSRLHDQGKLSDSEYQQAKNTLLGQL